MLGLIVGVLLTEQEVYGQEVLHDKRLKTSKQASKDNRKHFFKMEDREKASPAKVKVRTTKHAEGTLDNRNLLKPRSREKTQNYDANQRELNRPYSPEARYEGYRKTKKRSKNPNKTAAAYSGDLKALSLPRNLGRDVTHTENMKGSSQEAIKRNYKGKSQQVQQYSGDMRYSSLRKGKGRRINYSGKMAKSESKRSKDQDFRSRSIEMHRFAGFQKAQTVQKSRGGQFEGKIKIPSLSVKTNYFKKFSKKVNQYEGHLRIKDIKHKDLHPSASYLKRDKKSSREQKEKLRKRKILWFRFWKNSDQPNSVKQKPGKPKYDSRESEIWYK